MESSASASLCSVNAERGPVKEEPEWDECGVNEVTRVEVELIEDLYAGHEVKKDLVVGPELVQQQDVTLSMQNPRKLWPTGGAYGPLCTRKTVQRYGLKSCSVRLERLPVRILHTVSTQDHIIDCEAVLAFKTPATVGRVRTRGGRARRGGVFTRGGRHGGGAAEPEVPPVSAEAPQAELGPTRSPSDVDEIIWEVEVLPTSEPFESSLVNKLRSILRPARGLSRTPSPPLAPRSPTPMDVEEALLSPVRSMELDEAAPSTSASCLPVVSQARPARARESRANYGSEPESDSDEEEAGAPAIPRAFRALLETPEDEEESPPPQQSAPLPSSADVAIPSSDADATPSSAADATPSSVPVEPNNFLDFKWRPFPIPPVPCDMRREVFSEINVGPTAPHADPYEIFVRMWDRQFMEHIASETNKYAQQLSEQMIASHSLHPSSRICDWKDTSADELYVFFAILAAMGVVTKNILTDYWSANPSIFMTPGFHVYMSLRRFQLLCKCLHFRDNKDMDTRNLGRSEAKLYKIQPVIDHLNSVFQLSYNLQQNIALDESLLRWKGWLDINQFVPNKAAAVAIKTYEICESQTGYLWRFVVHAHKRTVTAAPDPLQAFVPSLVLELLQGLENKGHTVCMDNFFNSPALARKLKTLGFDCVGTLRTNRQFVPRELTNLSTRDMRPGMIAGSTSGDVDLLVWRDRSRMAAISTYHGNGTVTAREVTRPLLIQDYNTMMGGLDKKSQMLAAYPIERKLTRVWYKKLFRRLLNVSIVNSYIICKHNNPSADHRSFRVSLIESLLKYHSPHVPSVLAAVPQPRVPSSSPPTVFDHHLMETDYNPKIRGHNRRRCVVCKKRVTTFCSGCGKAACMNPCFVSMHYSTSKL